MGWRHAFAEQCHRRSQLGVAAAVSERRLDQVGGDPTTLQVTRYPFRAPALELALVLGEATRVAGVVENSGLLERLDGRVDGFRLNSLALEKRAQLGDGALPVGDRVIGTLDRPLGVARIGAQAASSLGASASASALASPAGGAASSELDPSSDSSGGTAASGAVAGSTPRTS